jgi:hypothetical protein
MQSEQQINEGIQNNDLVDLVSNKISIDQYKSKLGKDENVIVIAIQVMNQAPAEDLSQFIESGHSVLDVDVSTGPNEDGQYSVYVEINRDSKAYAMIDKIFADVKRADNTLDKIEFISYKSDTAVEWNEENFKDKVITSSYDYLIATNPEAKVIAERFAFLKDY